MHNLHTPTSQSIKKGLILLYPTFSCRCLVKYVWV